MTTTGPIDMGYVADFMQTILDSVVDVFTRADVDLPERRYISYGTPPADTEQVTVALQQLYLGTPGTPPTQPSQCNSPTAAIIRVEILRAVPVPEDRKLMVSADSANTAGIAGIADAELLLRSVSEMCGAAWGNQGVFADVSLPAEAGALGGPILTLTIGVP